jgi:Asp-tRNA(Asn)/Glu-tRNA(Gln) amidotransferase A subunit family amidase
MANSDDLCWLSASELASAIKRRKLSPVELMKAVLGRIERVNPRLNAFVTLTADQALKDARAAERLALKKGARLGPLHGVPFSTKDLVITKGIRTTFGTRLFADNVPTEDAPMVERLRAAGAIQLGKTNTPMMGWIGATHNLLFGITRNPWNLDRTPGGSSGGASAAVAAGLGPLAIGTDGGGSIRIPSSFNGVFGLQPSRGRVPDMAEKIGLFTSVVGPMTRDVRDGAMLMQAIACCDDRDPRSRRDAPPNYLAELDMGIEGVRAAWSPDLGRVVPDEPAIVALCHEAAQAFRKLGVRYDEPSFRFEDPHDELELDGDYAKWKMAALSRELMPGLVDPISWAMSRPRDEYGKITIYLRDRSDRPTALDYALSIKPEVRRRKRTHVDDFFNQYDLLLCPVVACTAFECGVSNVTPFQYTAYTFITNVAGYCGASVPIGFFEGMPVGLQIIGRPGEESLLLRAARAFERERPWAHLRPPTAI